MTHSRIFTIFLFISIAILSRIIPHPGNFTAINAIALFSTTYLVSLNASLFVVFASMFFSDLILGFHSQVLSVYFCFGVTVLFGYFFRSRVLSNMLASSVLFFIVTNFTEWLYGTLYPKTIVGLELCYVAAIPFFGNQILGDLFYGLVIMSAFSLRKQLQTT